MNVETATKKHKYSEVFWATKAFLALSGGFIKTVFVHLGLFWAHLDLLGPFQRQIIFCPNNTKCGLAEVQNQFPYPRAAGGV